MSESPKNATFSALDKIVSASWEVMNKNVQGHSKGSGLASEVIEFIETPRRTGASLLRAWGRCVFSIIHRFKGAYALKYIDIISKDMQAIKLVFSIRNG